MSEIKYPLAIRRGSDVREIPYWSSITIKYDSLQRNDDLNQTKNNFFAERTCSFFYPILNLPNVTNWEIFILITIMLNIIPTYYITFKKEDPTISTILFVHLLCLFYWIDFLLHIIHGTAKLPEAIRIKKVKTKFLIIDAVSLLPISVIYLTIEQNFTPQIFFWTRLITVIRVYRIPKFFTYATKTIGTGHWMIFLLQYVFYNLLAIHILAAIWVNIAEKQNIKIHNHNKTNENEFYVGVYFTLVTMLNVGFGDIVPSNHVEMIFCIFAMSIGFALTTAILLGALTSEITNKENRRETYRHEYSATIKDLKENQISDETVAKILDNHVAIWETRRGIMDVSQFMILPLSMQKEICFDITYGPFAKSLLFSRQRRSFLRR